jgi:hypothetical protein
MDGEIIQLQTGNDEAEKIVHYLIKVTVPFLSSVFPSVIIASTWYT